MIRTLLVAILFAGAICGITSLLCPPTVYDVVIAHQDENALDSILANVSGFCKLSCCCAPFADGITASGHVIQPGDKFIAAPKSYPFGTMISVQGYNNGQPVPVLDRGGAIRGNKLDLYFSDKDGASGHQRALNWGRQHLVVQIER